MQIRRLRKIFSIKKEDAGLAKGLNTIDGNLTNKVVAEAINCEFVDYAKFLV